MLEAPARRGRVPRLQTALRQFGRDERAEFCEAAARQGLGGSETFKGCQRPIRRGYLDFENRSDYSHATLKTDPPQAEMLAAGHFSANNGRRQALGRRYGLFPPGTAAPVTTAPSCH